MIIYSSLVCADFRSVCVSVCVSVCECVSVSPLTVYGVSVALLAAEEALSIDQEY